MPKKNFQAPRGTYDILPKDQLFWDFIFDTVRNSAFTSDFKRIETPIFEDAQLFIRSIGKATDIVEKEMYLFKDKSQNLLALRPEMTASVCRAYLENGMQALPQPVKLFYFGSMFRYERPQTGRFREFWQFGFEILGSESPIWDAQIISLAVRIFDQLNIKNIKIFVNSIGCQNCRLKYRKLLLDYINSFKKELCEDCRQRAKKNPLRILDCKNPNCQELLAQAPKLVNHLCRACHNHFRSVLEYLDDLELAYEINPLLVRGLDYYNRTVFEIFPLEHAGSQDALAAGGRYDYLIESLGGRSTPALGFAAGIERIIEFLKEENIQPPTSQAVSVFVAQLGEPAKKVCFKLIEDLQSAGIKAVGVLEKNGISNQLNYAKKLNIQLAILIGQKEVFDQTVLLKDLVSGSQETIPQEKIISILKKRLT